MTKPTDAALPGDTLPTAATQPDRDIISEKELRVRLPVSRRTIGTWRRKRIIPAITVGGRVLYHWPSVQAAMLRRQVGGGRE